MVQIKNKIAEIDRQLAAEVLTIKASFKAAYESSSNQEGEMRKQIETLKAEVLDLQKRSIQYNILKREADTNRSLYDGLLQRYKEVDVAGGVGANNVFVVDKAEVPGAPSSPQLSRALLLSLWPWPGRRCLPPPSCSSASTTRSSPPRRSSASPGLPTLGIIPKIASGTTVEQELADPRSALSEAYRSLCTALQFSTESGLPKTAGHHQRGTIRGQVAHVAGHRHGISPTMGLKVLLVDADLRNPSLHSKLGLDNCDRTQQLPDGSAARRPRPSRRRRSPTWRSWRPARCRPTLPICWRARACSRCCRWVWRCSISSSSTDRR